MGRLSHQSWTQRNCVAGQRFDEALTPQPVPPTRSCGVTLSITCVTCKMHMRVMEVRGPAGAHVCAHMHVCMVCMVSVHSACANWAGRSNQGEASHGPPSVSAEGTQENRTAVLTSVPKSQAWEEPRGQCISASSPSRPHGSSSHFWPLWVTSP